MKKQILLLSAGVLLASLLFFFGKTTSTKSNASVLPPEKRQQNVFDIQQYLLQEKNKLSTKANLSLTELENSVKRGNVKQQQIDAYDALAKYWKDSLQSFEGYAFYKSSSAKLENSEKNLTFAARLILESIRGEQNEAKLAWKTNETIDLFRAAIALNPNNDDLRIGLGSAFIFGKGRNGNPQETMEGIQELLAVVRRDSNNMKAQTMLGFGGIVSGQFDKSIDRLLKVVKVQPTNAEAIAYLADAYAGKGNKVEAVKWYNISKRLINDTHYSQEVDERIKQLK